MTRRRFLTAVGGAGAVVGALQVIDRGDGGTGRPFRAPTTSDFTLQGRANDTSVLVLGAGVAGLTCAYELGRLAHPAPQRRRLVRVAAVQHGVRPPARAERRLVVRRDWLSQATGWQHGAFESARATVSNLHAAVLRSG